MHGLKSLAALGVLLIPCIAGAQTLVVQPRVQGELAHYGGNVIVDSGFQSLPDGGFPIQVLIIAEFGIIDVTDLCSFAVSDSEVATFDSGTDHLTFVARGSMILEARYGPLVGLAQFNRFGAFDESGPGFPGIIVHGGAGITRGAGVPRDVLNQNTVAFVE